MKKFSIKNYGKPTPEKWRKVGDSLLAASAFGVTFTSIMKYELAAIIIVVIGITGKFLTNFFAKEKRSSSGRD